MLKLSRPFLVLLLTILVLQLSACGFRLRGAITLPESLSSVSIEGTTEHADLGRVLYRALKRGGVSITSAEAAALRLQILKDEVHRRVLSVDASGKANEYELKHLLRYTAVDKNDKVVVRAQDITTARAYKFDPNSLLAKGDEEQKLRKTIILSSAQQMLRQLTAALRQNASLKTDGTKPVVTPVTATPTETTPATK